MDGPPATPLIAFYPGKCAKTQFMHLYGHAAYTIAKCNGRHLSCCNAAETRLRFEVAVARGSSDRASCIDGLKNGSRASQRVRRDDDLAIRRHAALVRHPGCPVSGTTDAGQAVYPAPRSAKCDRANASQAAHSDAETREITGP